MSGEIPKVACFTGLTNIVQIGDISVHIQTEYLKEKMLLITVINRSGRCINRTERNCAEHVDKPDFYVKLAKVAQAQQHLVMRRVNEIWADYLKKQSISPPPSSSDVTAKRVTYLLDLGLRVYDIPNHDESVSSESARNLARTIWLEALELDPENRLVNACLSDLDDGIQMVQKIRRSNRIRQAVRGNEFQCKTKNA
ncbi:MAG: hypothetical protein WC708_00395 [Lentisphaeria bacterium]|jgi:hypothetical protein